MKIIKTARFSKTNQVNWNPGPEVTNQLDWEEEQGFDEYPSIPSNLEKWDGITGEHVTAMTDGGSIKVKYEVDTNKPDDPIQLSGGEITDAQGQIWISDIPEELIDQIKEEIRLEIGLPDEIQ